MKKLLLCLALLVLLSGCVNCTIGKCKCLESMLSMAQNKVGSCFVVLLRWAQWGVYMFTLASTAMLAVTILCVYPCVKCTIGKCKCIESMLSMAQSGVFLCAAGEFACLL